MVRPNRSMRVVATRPSLVPIQPLFLGREQQLLSIDERFESGARIVTLIGPPGMGKTRTALRHAELSRSRYASEGGIWIVELAHARDAASLCASIARTLGLNLGTRLEPDALAENLGLLLGRSGRTLLILDNAENVARTGARALSRICGAAPELRLLITSRQRFGVEGEALIDLPPLGLAAEDETDPDRIRSAEAVLLFAHRARALGCALDPADLTDVARLVRELDGIPLAIELAAGRSRILGPRQILERLSKRFEILQRPDLAGIDRHATLRAAIDWSWTMLSPPERTALSQCALFAGSFDLVDAEAVLDLGSSSPEAGQGDEVGPVCAQRKPFGAAPARSRPRPAFPVTVLNVLEALRDRSLIEQSSDSHGGGRFRLYASIREYAHDRLAETGALDRAQDRHRLHYLTRGRELRERLCSTGDARARRALSLERENLVACHRTARTAAERADAVLSLEPTLSAEGPFALLLELLDRALEDLDTDPPLQARLLIARGYARGLQGNGDASIADLERGIAVAERIDDSAIRAEGLVMLGVRRRVLDDLEGAEQASRLAITLIDPLRQKKQAGNANACLGLLLAELDRRSEARESNERAHVLARALDDRWSEGLVLGNLAQLDQAEGSFERARAQFEGAIEAFRSAHDLRYEGLYLGHLAGLEHEVGRFARARVLYQRALGLLEHAGSGYLEGLFLAGLGALDAMEDRVVEAAAQLARADSLLGQNQIAGPRAAAVLHRAQIDLSDARRAKRDGRADRAESAIQRVRARLDDAATQPVLARSQAARFAHRLLSRGLSGLETADELSLIVSADGNRFALPGRETIDLSRRGPLRRLLHALIERRIAEPGTSTDAQTLLARGWPDDRVQWEAGSTRVRVAIATLRRLGLEKTLLTRDSGYLLDPDTAIIKGGLGA
jgi:predicted ATPase